MPDLLPASQPACLCIDVRLTFTMCRPPDFSQENYAQLCWIYESIIPLKINPLHHLATFQPPVASQKGMKFTKEGLDCSIDKL